MSVTAAAGFVAAGIHGGVKEDPEALDLALVATEDGQPVADLRDQLAAAHEVPGGVLDQIGRAHV